MLYCLELSMYRLALTSLFSQTCLQTLFLIEWSKVVNKL